MLLPHEFFACVYQHYNAHFQATMVGSESAVDFWANFVHSPAWTQHSASALGITDFSKVVPLGLHGDGVAMTGIGRAGAHSATVLNFSSLLTSGPTIDYCFVISMLWHTVAEAGHMNEVWQVLAWSFYWLQRGTWPQRDHKGRRFPDGSRGARIAFSCCHAT